MNDQLRPNGANLSVGAHLIQHATHPYSPNASEQFVSNANTLYIAAIKLQA